LRSPHTKDSILRDFERRLPNNAERNAEIGRGDQQDCRVACRSTHDSEDRLKCTGLVDACARYPQRQAAAGIEVELVELSDLGASRVVTARSPTPTAGPINRWFTAPVPIGRYEMTFSVGKYLRNEKCRCQIRILDLIPLRFSVSDPKAISTCRSWSRHELRDVSRELKSCSSW